ncbi:antichymotrypsin-2-like [Halictus rubicundus]|uniref:antichymotrypsin-2-like n=1 Tax=Halictus rubicundus TaxID=77578 RepID=UPI00403531F3
MAAPNTNPEALNAVAQGTNQFSGTLFQAVVQESPSNLIMSPLSAAVVLAMAAYGAGGETERQLKQGLHIPSPDQFGLTGYKKLITDLSSVTDNKLLLANKAFVNIKFTLKPSYKALTENYFQSVTESVNFQQSEQAANTINIWVKEKTNNHIESIVTSAELNGGTALVLVNAVYFNGTWKLKFDPELTKKLPFHVNENVMKEVPTMFKQADYNYGELPSLNAKFIEIPYQGNSISMLIILPNEINGLAEVEKKIQSTNLADILSQGRKPKVKLFLPKFKIESQIDLISPLQKIGLTDMFTGHANFSGITDDPLVVSNVIQKAFIEVNEEGSVAAAATATRMMCCGVLHPPPIPVVRIDRPFFYAILHKSQNAEGKGISTTLFSGRISDPSA